jgi:hypothetical protein
MNIMPCTDYYLIHIINVIYTIQYHVQITILYITLTLNAKRYYTVQITMDMMKCMRANEYYDIMTAGTEEKYAAAENATALAKAGADAATNSSAATDAATDAATVAAVAASVTA